MNRNLPSAAKDDTNQEPIRIVRQRTHTIIPSEAQHDVSFILLRTREARITRIALAIVWLFLFCHIWRLVPTIHELIFDNKVQPMWLTHMMGFSHSMIVFNSAVNTVLYAVL